MATSIKSGRQGHGTSLVGLPLALGAACFARTSFAVTNTISLTTPVLADAGPSLLRVMGALALVLGVFLGGVWLFRNGRNLRFGRGRANRLNVLEVRSLGGRHALYVVGYDQERFLLGST